MERCELVHEIKEVTLMVRECLSDIDRKFKAEDGKITCPEVESAINTLADVLSEWKHG